jgi:DNA-binding NarL/FixJ family response regulator
VSLGIRRDNEPCSQQPPPRPRHRRRGNLADPAHATLTLTRHVMPLNCFVVEDSPVIRQNLIATLEEMLPLKVVGWAEDERSAIHWMTTAGAACELMIIDIFLKSGTGMEVVRQAGRLLPQAHLVVLTNYATPEMRQRCRMLGADQVFDKSAEVDELLAYCAALADGHA